MVLAKSSDHPDHLRFRETLSFGLAARGKLRAEASEDGEVPGAVVGTVPGGVLDGGPRSRAASAQASVAMPGMVMPGMGAPGPARTPNSESAGRTLWHCRAEGPGLSGNS